MSAPVSCSHSEQPCDTVVYDMLAECLCALARLDTFGRQDKSMVRRWPQ